MSTPTDYLGVDYTVQETLLSHDGVPLIVLCTDRENTEFVGSATKETNDTLAYLLAPLPPETKKLVLAGKMDFRDVFYSPHTKSVTRVTLDWAGSDTLPVVSYETFDSHLLTEEELPERGARF